MPHEKWNHFDFLWGRDADKLLYAPLLQVDSPGLVKVKEGRIAPLDICIFMSEQTLKTLLPDIDKNVNSPYCRPSLRSWATRRRSTQGGMKIQNRSETIV